LNKAFFDYDQYSIPKRFEGEIIRHDKDDLLVVVYASDYDMHSELLSKILLAIKFDLQENVCLIKLKEDEQFNLSRLSMENISEVICIGIKPNVISMNASFAANVFYQTESFSIMLTHSLERLSQDNKRKKALWNALQIKFLK